MSGVRRQGGALTVEGGAVGAVGPHAVVVEREELPGDLLALSPGEERAALLHGVGGQRRAQHAEEGGRDERVEHHRHFHRRALASAQESASPRGRLAATSVGIQVLERPAQYVGVSRLDLTVLFGEDVGEGVALVRAIGTAQTRGAGDEDLAVTVCVHGVLDRLDPPVGGKRRCFDGERDLDALRVGRRGEALVEGVDIRRLAARNGKHRELVWIADRGMVDGAPHDVVQTGIGEV